MKSKDLQPRFLYPAKLSFRIKGHLKSFPDKRKLKEFITTKPVLYEMLKAFLKKEEEEGGGEGGGGEKEEIKI